MTCPDCERMRRQIERLEREVGVRKNDGELAAIMTRLEVTATHARLIRRLYVTDKPVSRDALMTLLSTHDDSNLRTTICRIRTVLGEGFIETVNGIGYRLSAEGMSRVMAAVLPVEMQDLVA